MHKDPMELFRVADLPTNIDPAQFYPSKAKLHQEQSFCKHNPYKLYSVAPVVSNIAVVLWKSGLLDSADSINLAAALPNGQTTFASWNKLQRTNFSTLQLMPFDYNIYDTLEVESTVNALKRELHDACLLH